MNIANRKIIKKIFEMRIISVKVCTFRDFLLVLLFAMLFKECAPMTQFIDKILELHLNGSTCIHVLKQLVTQHEERLDKIKG